MRLQIFEVQLNHVPHYGNFELPKDLEIGEKTKILGVFAQILGLKFYENFTFISVLIFLNKEYRCIFYLESLAISLYLILHDFRFVHCGILKKIKSEKQLIGKLCYILNNFSFSKRSNRSSLKFKKKITMSHFSY